MTAEDNHATVAGNWHGGNDGDGVMRDLLVGHDARRQPIIRNTEEALHYLAWQTDD
jgi:hypothetical protein